MKFTLTIDMDNAAFQDEGEAPELARILRKLASGLETYDLMASETVMDVNGNTVGRWEVTES